MKPVMNFFKRLSNQLTKKNNKFLGLFVLLVIIVLAGVLYRYNGQKGLLSDGMSNNLFSNVGKIESSEKAPSTTGLKQGAELPNNNSESQGVKPVETTDGEQYLNVNVLTSGSPSNKTCNNKPVMDPKQLLPTDSNNEWSNIMPNNDLKNIGMLNAGHHVGVNTVGSSLRNPNLQIRSEPTIPQTNIGPWNNTTIEADTLRRPLEIGGSC